MGKLATVQAKACKSKIGKAMTGGAAAGAVEEALAGPAPEVWSQGELIGRACRMVDEAVPQTFGAPGKITGQRGDTVKLEVEGQFHAVVCKASQIDLLPQLTPSGPKLPLHLTKAVKTELLREFPELEDLLAGGRLTGDHMNLGAWIIERDLGDVQGSSFMAPMVVYSYCFALAEPGPDGEACKIKAQQLLSKRLKSSGLLGLPIWTDGGAAGAEHWTLLVLRRLKEEVRVRYYDSLEVTSPHNFAAAETVLKMLMDELKIPQPELVRSNRAVQHNGVDCGVFVLHYWEGELRRFRGESWPLSYPWTSGPIKERKRRLVSLVSQLRKALVAAEAKGHDGDGKKKGAGKPADKVEGEAVGKGVSQLAKLEELSKVAKEQGLVEFFGCSRCRWQRGGCINWFCNPNKFQAHKEKFPEKYESRKWQLKAEIQCKNTD
ncbi:MAG: hypothetical protein GY772_19410, partial [bacterium]|nr:hypothetical protein [bacterium]